MTAADELLRWTKNKQAFADILNGKKFKSMDMFIRCALLEAVDESDFEGTVSPPIHTCTSATKRSRISSLYVPL